MAHRPIGDTPMLANTDIFEFEGDTLRIRTLGENSGARETALPKAKWVLERRLYNGLWERASHTFLDNSANVADAKKQFGF